MCEYKSDGYRNSLCLIVNFNNLSTFSGIFNPDELFVFYSFIPFKKRSMQMSLLWIRHQNKSLIKQFNLSRNIRISMKTEKITEKKPRKYWDTLYQIKMKTEGICSYYFLNLFPIYR